MTDMAKFIAAKSDQLNSDDLAGGPLTVTITHVRETDASDQPVAVHFEGDGGKPYKPNLSMRRVMVHCWGKYAEQYKGRSMTLYRDPKVRFGAMEVGGIRISHISHIDEKKTMALNSAKGKKGLFTVLPLAGEAAPPAKNVSNELEQLRALARPGNMAALQDKWNSIGAEARKLLAGELPALKDACAVLPDPAPDPDDVAFDAPQTTGGTYDGA